MPEIVVESHPIDTVFRADRLPHIWCPGCGIGPAVHAYAQAILESGIPKDQHACVSGIGCTARVPGYMDVDSYHTTHGRAIPFAMAIAVVPAFISQVPRPKILPSFSVAWNGGVFQGLSPGGTTSIWQAKISGAALPWPFK